MVNFVGIQTHQRFSPHSPRMKREAPLCSLTTDQCQPLNLARRRPTSPPGPSYLAIWLFEPICEPQTCLQVASLRHSTQPNFSLTDHGPRPPVSPLVAMSSPRSPRPPISSLLSSLLSLLFLTLTISSPFTPPSGIFTVPCRHLFASFPLTIGQHHTLYTA